MAGFTDGKRFLKEIDGSAKLIVAVNVEIGQRKGKIISDYFVDKRFGAYNVDNFIMGLNNSVRAKLLKLEFKFIFDKLTGKVDSISIIWVFKGY